MSSFKYFWSYSADARLLRGESEFMDGTMMSAPAACKEARGAAVYDAVSVDFSGRPLSELSGFFDSQGIAFTDISHANWRSFPAKPTARFRLAHTGDALLLNFHVEESGIRALRTADNSSVWLDSCAEFFIEFAGDVCYYNVECNCIGAVLVGRGASPDGRTKLATDGVGRFATLGSGPIEGLSGLVIWELGIRIPAALFGVAVLPGLRARGNFYKCGDELPTPHFLSWAPIATPAPSFHQPAFFGAINFL
jgi:hypothetical protein